MSNTFIPAAAQAPTSNTDAVATMAAPTDGSRWVLESISYSYSATPTGATLVITSDTFTETYYVTLGGVGVLSWPFPRMFAANKGITITLKAGGSGIFGTVYPQASTKH